MSYTVLCGDVRVQLAALPAASVHCVITSPPYLGVRAYGTAPQVWGGDPACAHLWWEALTPAASGGHNPKQDSNTGSWAGPRPSATCARCAAWRGELGGEPTPALFVAHLVEVFRAVRRVLRPDGTLWLNMGDSYAGSGKGPTGWNGLGDQEARLGSVHGESGHTSGVTPPLGLKAKDLMLVPERLAIALQDDGWYVRSRIAWCKLAPMPESVTDRPTSAWEHIWLLSPRRQYFYDADAVRMPWADAREGRDGSARAGERNRGGRMDGYTKPNGIDPSANGGANLRNWWPLPPEPFNDAHFATFPTEIPRRAILAGTSAYGCCAACGAPWRRVTERARPMDAGRSEQAKYIVLAARNDTTRRLGSQYQAQLDAAPPVTTGWAPTCACACPDVVPATVLDPFSGAGTTCLVAHRLGRHGIGIELNEDYAAMSLRRLAADMPLVDAVEAATAQQPALPLEVG